MICGMHADGGESIIKVWKSPDRALTHPEEVKSSQGGTESTTALLF